MSSQEGQDSLAGGGPHAEAEVGGATRGGRVMRLLMALFLVVA
jgi:hypothetical protein